MIMQCAEEMFASVKKSNFNCLGNEFFKVTFATGYISLVLKKSTSK